MVEIIRKNNKNWSEKPKLSREIIAQLGEKLYQFKDIEMIVIQAEFKDGSGIRFRKTEEDDD